MRGKCGSNDEKIFKEEESTQILKILGLIDNKWVKVSCIPNFMFNDETFLDYINLFLSNKYDRRRKHKFKL